MLPTISDELTSSNLNSSSVIQSAKPYKKFWVCVGVCVMVGVFVGVSVGVGVTPAVLVGV